ncbi:polysaccharide deacetylase family protein [Halalkalibacterium halodurans]|uniref:Polysaccharide deacetylase n=1 Tax=Halalkalibacterium halodurans TaxID=86665 RepID=A0A0M0KLF4_ALKHA|nr:polysaccharide deacetylase family protein [Halalkalibacterium halodurans]TPE69046.1 polysaccharide deacetylase [Halalkalibacterium halodurans]
MRKGLIILLTTLTILLGVYGVNEWSKSRSFQVFGGLVNHVATNEPVIALTFDDGPTALTDDILSILQEEDIKATFFLTGIEIEEHMEEAQKIVAAGHEIGNHSYSHQRMVFKSPSFIREEIERTDEWIRQAGYEGDIHFRPPFGKKLVVLPYYLSQQERKTVLWNIEPETFPEITMDSQKITDYVMETVEPGSIILLHVMYESRKPSIEAVKELIPVLKQEGYTFVTVSELLEYEEIDS